MAIPFMKDEAEGTRLIAFWACVAITFGLALVSLFGVWAEDGEAITFWIFVGKVFWSIAIVGAEFLVAMALQRALIAPTKMRKAGGVLVFAMLAYFCVGNVERGVHAMYPTVFKSDTQQLKDLAALAGTQATTITTAATTAISSIPEQMATARADLAKLEAELKLISASDGTETSIKSAQRHLQGLNYYDGNIDGQWEELTTGAVQRRGSEIRNDMELKRNIIKGLETGVPVTTNATANESASKDKIENEAKARKREAFGNQVLFGAWTLEGARSLGWIVFLSGLTVAAVSMAMRREDELADLEHENRKAEILAQRVTAPIPAATPEPAPAVAAPPPPEPVQEPAPIEPLVAPPPEEPRSDASQRARNAGKANAHMNKADELRSVILVNDNRARNAERDAAPLAAQ